jgi:lipoprotein NlpD
MRLHGIGPCVVAAALLGGCAWRVEQPVPPRDAGALETPSSTATPAAAPAGRTAARRKGDDRPEFHVVRRGDTLFAIALDYGFDYRDIATWNALADPSRILVGQRLRLSPPAEGVSATARRTEVTPRAKGPEAPVVRLETAPPPEPGTVIKPMGTTGAPEAESLGGEAKPSSGARSVPLLAEPRAQTLPYSQPALERLSRPGAAATPGPQAAAAAPAAGAEAVEEEALDWAWPVQGDLVYRFGDSGRLKGIGIGGKAGQPVSAAADGRVVYSGSGLRGYGRLLIVKHNEAYLSVYAHNQALLVKEGERVRRGQKIAEMGDSDASRVLLHFEMRRFGKPVDPLAKLPAS